MSFRVLLADADGTLFDFHKGESVALEQLFERFGVPQTEEYRAAYLRANAEQWKMLERGETTQPKLRLDRFVNFLRDVRFDADAQEMADAFVELLSQQRWPFAYTDELCRRVSERMPIYLITNGIAQVQRGRFGDCSITPYLSGMVISEEVGAAKPDPAMIFEALKLAGNISPKDAVVLGDSVTADIAAANNAGVRSILFTNGRPIPENHGATWAVGTLEEACEIILAGK